MASAPRPPAAAPARRAVAHAAPGRVRRRRFRRAPSCRARNGASQSGEAASAASERSGQASGSARRRNITRSRHCLSAFRPWQPRRRRDRERRAPARARSPRRRATASVCSASTSAPSRRRRRARNAAAARSKVTSSARLDRGAGDRLDLLARQRRGGEDARRRRAADDFADREEVFAARAHRAVRAPPRGRSPSGTRRVCRAPSRCDRETRRRAMRRASSPRLRRARAATSETRAARQIAREPPRVLRARRAVAAEILQPMRQIDRVAA